MISALGVSAGADLLNAGVGIYNAWASNKLGKKQIKLAEQSLAEQQAQNKWEREKYTSTLNNQQEGINALGKSFEAVSANAAQAQNPPSATNTAQSNTLSAPVQNTQNTQATNIQSPALAPNIPQNVPQKQTQGAPKTIEQPLPTERY